MQLRKLFLASSLLIVSAVSIAAEPESKANTQSFTDIRQETQIWTTYALSPYLRAHDLKVVVLNGTATLTGTVEEEVNKALAKQIALGVHGIKEVDNQIVIAEDYVPPMLSSSRGYGEIVDDATIAATVKSKLMWSKHADGLAIEVESKGGRVTLQGTTDSKAAHDFAGRLAENSRGVVSVDNQLKIDDSKFKQAGSPKNSVIKDSWITTKVKSTFMYSTNVNGSNISVTTKDGVVDLSGKVSSGAEHALAIEFAQNVRGVKSVTAKKLTH